MAKSDKPLVLVADDEPSTLALVASHLRGRGYRVSEANDGDDAWDKACRELPDLVVLDVMMPGMSGWEVCRKVREAVSLAHTGIIMLTGIGETLNELTSPLYGADAYLDKPFQFNQLADVVKQTLESRQSGALGRPEVADTAGEEQRKKTNGRPAARLWKSARDEEKREPAPRQQRHTKSEGGAAAPAKSAPAEKKPAQKAAAKPAQTAEKAQATKPAQKAAAKPPAQTAEKTAAAKKTAAPQAAKAPAKQPAKVSTKKAAAKAPAKATAKAPAKATAKASPKKTATKSLAKKAPAKATAKAPAKAPARAAKKPTAKAAAKAPAKAPARAAKKPTAAAKTGKKAASTPASKSSKAPAKKAPAKNAPAAKKTSVGKKAPAAPASKAPASGPKTGSGKPRRKHVA